MDRIQNQYEIPFQDIYIRNCNFKPQNKEVSVLYVKHGYQNHKYGTQDQLPLIPQIILGMSGHLDFYLYPTSYLYMFWRRYVVNGVPVLAYK